MVITRATYASSSVIMITLNSCSPGADVFPDMFINKRNDAAGC